MQKIIIISDLYKEDYEKANRPSGGAELNDGVLFEHLENLNLVKAKIHSNEYELKFMLHYLQQNKDCTFLISNFANLHFRASAFLIKHCRYFIYEHDYKFHKYRNPINYKDFIVPKEELINVNFFKKAEQLICLSKLHKDIFEKNLEMRNVHNTTCSLWTDEDLNYIAELSKSSVKNGKAAIVNTDNPIKRKKECIQYCRKNNIDYDLISSPDYKDFLKMMSTYESIVILPGHPEPTPRVAVEAKMLNCKIHSNSRTLGVAYEDWFHLNGEDLIEEIRNIKNNTLSYITKRLINEV
tara:strand:- start:1085 stop:1972 length:888 start_codon:yes stop_codon:yes gene_type:complete